jgi:hypothetical protein
MGSSRNFWAQTGKRLASLGKDTPAQPSCPNYDSQRVRQRKSTLSQAQHCEKRQRQ